MSSAADLPEDTLYRSYVQAVAALLSTSAGWAAAAPWLTVLCPTCGCDTGDLPHGDTAHHTEVMPQTGLAVMVVACDGHHVIENITGI